MVGLQFLQVSLINIAGHSAPTKEIYWLLSVFAGIMMCKIVSFQLFLVSLCGFGDNVGVGMVLCY